MSQKSELKFLPLLLMATLLVGMPGNALSQGKEEVRSIKAFYDTLNCLRFLRAGDLPGFPMDNFKQIVLMRHGEPMLSRTGGFKREDAIRYIQAYDTVNVYPFERGPFCSDSGELRMVYTSELQRSRHTARLVFGPQQRLVSRKDFNEFQRKIIKFPNIRISMGLWSGLSRALWILGFNDKGIESFGEAKMRAFKGAAFLEFVSQAEGKAVLVAHGFLNRYIKKYLKKRGWHLVDRGGKEYYGAYVLFRFGDPGGSFR